MADTNAPAIHRRGKFPATCRAQGTAVTTTPCSGQLTLGLSASSQVTVLPRSRARHPRGPSPRSNPGPRLRHNPQRSRYRQPSRTVTTSAPVSGSSLAPSTTAPASPSPLAHTRHWRTAPEPLSISVFDDAEIVGILGSASLLYALKL